MRMKKFMTCLLAGTLMFTSIGSSFAWKLNTHVYSGNIILEDLKDGYLTIDGYGDYKVPNEIYNAVMNNPESYRAGTLGPDTYPEIPTGQGNIHAWEKGDPDKYSSGAYLNLMVDEYLSLPLNHPEREKILAFILGYSTHYAGDLYGHDFINEWADGVFPSMEEMADDKSKTEIALRHILSEGYVDSKVPDNHRTGDNIKINAPISFIQDTLVERAAEESEVSMVLDPIMALNKNLKQTAESQKAFNGNFLDYAIDTNVAGYADRWSSDIDSGIYRYIEANQEMAWYMLNKDYGTTDAMAPIEEWVTNDLLKMGGSPDAIAVALGVSVDTILELLNMVTTEEVREKISNLKKDIIFYAVEEATGVDLEDMLNAMKDPKPLLNSDLFATGDKTTDILDAQLENFGQTEDMSELTFAPFYNTVQMGKLILLGADNLQNIFPNSEFKPQQTIESFNKIDVKIKTGKNSSLWSSGSSTRGTDDDIFFFIKLRTGEKYEVLMDKPGHNDFESNDNDTYTLELPERIRYEMISSIGVRKKVVSNDDWYPDWIEVSARDGKRIFESGSGKSDGSFHFEWHNSHTYEKGVSLSNSVTGTSQFDASIINFIKSLDGSPEGDKEQIEYSKMYRNDRATYEVLLNGGKNSGASFASYYKSLVGSMEQNEDDFYYTFDEKSDDLNTKGSAWKYGDSLTCSTDSHAVAVLNSKSYRDFTAEADISVKKGGNAGIEYRMSNMDSNKNMFKGYMAGIGIDNSGKGYAFIGRQNYDYKGLNDTTWNIQSGVNYTIRIVAEGPEMKMYINDQLAVTANDSMHKEGYVGFQVWNTNAEMDYLQIQSKTAEGIEKYDFYEDVPAFEFVGDKWEYRVENESTQLKGFVKGDKNAFAVKTDETYENVLLKTNMALHKKNEEAGLLLHVNAYSDVRIQEGYEIGVETDEDGNGKIRLRMTEAGENSKILQVEDVRIKYKEEFELAVAAESGVITVFVDNRQALQYEDDTFTSGQMGVYLDDSRAYFDNLEIVKITKSSTNNSELTDNGTQISDASLPPQKNTQEYHDDFVNWPLLGVVDGQFSGNKAYDGSVYVVPNGSDDAYATIPNAYLADGCIESKITVYDAIDGSNHDSGVVFRASNVTTGNDMFTGYFAGLRAGQDGGIILGKYNQGQYTEIKLKKMPIHSRTVYDLKVDSSGNSIKVYINGQLMIDETDSSYREGTIALRSLRMAAIYQNIDVTQ